MKLNKIITVAGLVVLVALGTSCQSKKAKEAAERAAAEAAARAAAEAAAAAAKPAPVFELSDAVKAGVFIHGYNADSACKKFSRRGLTVFDLTEHLGILMSEFEA